MNRKGFTVFGMNYRTTVAILLLIMMSCAGALAENIAPLGVPAVSSEYMPRAGARINDGSYVYPNGAWISSGEKIEPHWASITWKDAQTITGVRIYFMEYGKEQSPDWPAKFICPAFKIQTLISEKSPDQEDSWKTLDDVEQNTDSPYVFRTKVPVTTQAIRVFVIEATSHSAFSDKPGERTAAIKEIEVWTGEMPPTPKSVVLDKGISYEGTAEQEYPYYEVKKPLFKELFSNKSTSKVTLYYGYNDLFADEVYRPFSKKFGNRYVQEEERRELIKHNFIPNANAWARGGVGNFPPTMRQIIRPDYKTAIPPMIGNNPWIMHPLWQEAYLKEAERFARLSLDNSPGNIWGNTFGLWAGDEVFESFGCNVVPKEKRDDAVNKIDQEIREKYGFGKYGLPDSDEDKDPFKRIASRRWVNDRLVELFKKAYPMIKKINPKLVVLGPNPCGGLPPVDLEAMSDCFDLQTNQSWYAPDPYVQRLATGADVKALVDLSDGVPVWPMPQNQLSRDPETLREQYSQVYRNGGQGLWLLATEWYDRELDHPKYTDPEKWRGLLEIVDTTVKMKLPKIPKADTAILYSSDTFLTFDSPKMVNAEHRQIYSAYTAIGPGTGTWFRFVSDRQIDRGQKKLSDYKTLYVPIATYERSSILTEIEKFVKNGGVLVCTEPTAFSWDINGEALSSRWEQLTGAQIGAAKKDLKTASTVSNGFLKGKKQFTFNVPSEGFELKAIASDVQPFAVFPDGSTAATIRKLGKGWVIFFASDPFALADHNPGMESLVRIIQVASKCAVDKDIWRFKLPHFKTVKSKYTEAHLCLTNNNIEMYRGMSNSWHNLNTKGSYTYDTSPDGYADYKTTSGWIPFSSGRLTNRKAAYNMRDRTGDRGPTDLGKWIVSWKNISPFSVTFDLKDVHMLDRVRLVYSGAFPGVKVQGSADASTWVDLASAASQPSTEDVPDLILPVKGKYHYVRFAFPARQAGQILELCEAEIWGDGK